MTLALTQHDTTQPNTLLRRPVAALDAGNRTTQWVTSTGQVMTIPSVIKKLEPWEEAEFDDESVLVEVIDKDGNKTERCSASQSRWLGNWVSAIAQAVVVMAG